MKSSSPPRLRIHFPDGKEQVVTVDTTPFTIGRRPECSLVITQNDVSRLQAEIIRKASRYILTDKASTFTTKVNGATGPRHLLSNRDVITMGRTGEIEMLFLLKDSMSEIVQDVDSRPRDGPTAEDYRNLTLLLELGRRLNSMRSLREVLDLTLDAVLDATSADRGFLMLRDEQGELQMSSARNVARERLDTEKLRISTSIVGEVIASGQARFLTDLSKVPQVRDRSSIVELSLQSVVCVPLLAPLSVQWARPSRLPADSDVLGIIYADSSHARRPLSAVTQNLITSIAYQAALTVENHLLRQEDLDRRIMEREMERQIDRLREMDRIKTEFLSNVSHELRTPLTAIKGSIENMLDGLTGELSERQRRYLKRVAGNTDQLSRLISDLLDLSALESGRAAIAVRRTSVLRLLEDAAESMRPVAIQKGIALTVALPREELVVTADRDRVMQVLVNLMGNALKFTPRGGSVILTARHEEQCVSFSVSDSGPGIPQDQLERIFDRFYQIPSPDGDKTGGTGLGLPIARTLIELQGGRLWAESEGDGSRFLFTLPEDPPSSVPPAAAAPVSPARREAPEP